MTVFTKNYVNSLTILSDEAKKNTTKILQGHEQELPYLAPFILKEKRQIRTKINDWLPHYHAILDKVTSGLATKRLVIENSFPQVAHFYMNSNFLQIVGYRTDALFKIIMSGRRINLFVYVPIRFLWMENDDIENFIVDNISKK